MKKLLALITLMLCSAAMLFAADNSAVLSKIEKVNSGVKSLQAALVQTKTVKASGKTTVSKASVYYQAEDKMAVIYTDPEGDKLVMNGTRFFVKMNGKTHSIDASKNGTADNIRTVLMNCMHGKIQPVADEYNADIAITESGGNYVITLTAKKKSSKGFSKIILYYKKADCLVNSMEMTDFSGVTTSFVLSGLRSGVSIDPAVFSTSKK